MRYPDNYLFYYPGFPSIMVSYIKANDFFYSGHVGFPILLLCEFYILKRYFMCVFCIFTFFIETFTMVVLRGHYSIDLISGAIFAHYIFQNVEKHIHHLDFLTFRRNEITESENLKNKPIKMSNKTDEYSINEFKSKKEEHLPLLKKDE